MESRSPYEEPRRQWTIQVLGVQFHGRHKAKFNSSRNEPSHPTACKQYGH